MNYAVLKSVIETTIRNYNTKQEHKITMNHVFIKAISGQSVDIMIKCPVTQNEINVKAEINMMSTEVKTDTPVDNIQTTTTKIGDQDVMSVRQALKQNESIEDLFKDN